eukprot:5105284-Amphidinium_carterae.2
MYSESRRILIQGAVSESVQSTCGLPPGCGLAVDLLHAFLTRTLQSVGRQVEVRNYRDVIKALRHANMQVNPKKTVIICNGTHTKNKLKKAWRDGLLPPVKITTRDLGLSGLPGETLRIRTFEQSMHRVRGLGLPAHAKARIVKSLHSVGLYGAEVGDIPKSGMTKLRTCARKALGKGAGLRRSAPLALMAHAGPAADDPQVSADLSTAL